MATRHRTVIGISQNAALSGQNLFEQAPFESITGDSTTTQEITLNHVFKSGTVEIFVNGNNWTNRNPKRYEEAKNASGQWKIIRPINDWVFPSSADIVAKYQRKIGS